MSGNIERIYGFQIGFSKWNPSVDIFCSEVLPDMVYCNVRANHGPHERTIIIFGKRNKMSVLILNTLADEAC